jgi:hypothetical protein
MVTVKRDKKHECGLAIDSIVIPGTLAIAGVTRIQALQNNLDSRLHGNDEFRSLTVSVAEIR